MLLCLKWKSTLHGCKKGDNSECICCGVSQQKAEMTFCLTSYDAYGFDLDHTLAKYKLTELCRVCNCQQTELTTISYMPTFERLKVVGRGVFFSEGRKMVHFGYKICVVKTLNIV